MERRRPCASKGRRLRGSAGAEGRRRTPQTSCVGKRWSSSPARRIRSSCSSPRSRRTNLRGGRPDTKASSSQSAFPGTRTTTPCHRTHPRGCPSSRSPAAHLPRSRQSSAQPSPRTEPLTTRSPRCIGSWPQTGSSTGRCESSSPTTGWPQESIGGVRRDAPSRNATAFPW